MADPLCKFIDARSVTGSQFTYFSSQKPFLSLPFVTFHKPSLFTRRKRRKRETIHIAFCSTPTSPILDIISAQEHSDGSLLFRFGDPSEVAKEDELEATSLGVEEVERDGEEEFTVVKVLDGDNEREVIIKKLEREATNQAVTVATDVGVPESVLTNNERSDFVERETGMSEIFLVDSKDETNSVSPLAEVNNENAGDVVESSEKKDESEASIPSLGNPFPALEVQADMKGQSSEEFEELDDDKSPLLGSPAAIYSDSGTPEEIEEAEGEVLSQLIENGSDRDQQDDSNILMENAAASEVQVVDDVGDQTEKISESVDPIMEEPSEIVHEEINLEKTVTAVDEIAPENADVRHLSINAEDLSTQVLDIDIDDQTEKVNISPDIEDQASDNGTLNDSGENNTTEVMPLSAKLEAEPILEEEIDVNMVLESNAGENPLPSTQVLNIDNDDESGKINISPDTEDQASQIGTLNDSGETNTTEVMPLSTTMGAEPVLEEDIDENLILESNAGESPLQVVDHDGDQAAQISENIDPIVEESSEIVHEETNLEKILTVVDEITPENADVRQFSMNSEDQSNQVLIIDNDDQNEKVNISSRTDTLNGCGETNTTEVVPLSAKLEAEPILEEEIDDNLTFESNAGESPLLPDEKLPHLSLEAERKEDIEQVSGDEVLEDKSSEVLDSSKEATPPELILSSGATLMQYPSKELTGGHEAYFVACGKWLGVADGVGRWSLEGSDPGVYAKELMQNSEYIVSECEKDLINDPKQVLNLSVSKTDSPGSSTALIAHFDGKDLHVANIGDSGFLIVRNGSVYRKSSPMLHEFNLPIQVEKGDDPYQLLEEYNIELDEGDVIVTATDGLFDNLYEQEIVSIVSKSLEADKSPQEIAEILGTRVVEVGSCGSGRSPFADAAQAAGYVGYTGGKRDDVVVIVSVVVQPNFRSL